MLELKRHIGDIVNFSDHPEFTPNVTPAEMFELGVFGGTYWRPIYSSIINKNLENQHLEFDFLRSAGEEKLTGTKCNPLLNYYKAKAGSSLHDWESKGWIVAQDPYGWVQWYCRFYNGRRTADDARQIERWQKYAGSQGRWKRNLDNQIKTKGASKASKVVRQGLLQWAYIDAT